MSRGKEFRESLRSGSRRHAAQAEGSDVTKGFEISWDGEKNPSLVLKWPLKARPGKDISIETSDGGDINLVTSGSGHVDISADTSDSDADYSAPLTINGTPVVESGSNDDGEWTRWADGTQVCLVESTFSVSSSDWNDLKDTPLYYAVLGPFYYPKTFISKPGLAFQAAEYFWFRSTIRDWDTEKVKTDIIRESEKSYSNIEIIATTVGRWK